MDKANYGGVGKMTRGVLIDLYWHVLHKIERWRFERQRARRRKLEGLIRGVNDNDAG